MLILGGVMISWREVRFLICTIGVLMVYKIFGAGWLMNAAAINALLNLFSGQYLCSTNSCTVSKSGITIPWWPYKMVIPTDPITIAHNITTVIGLLLLFCSTAEIFIFV